MRLAFVFIVAIIFVASVRAQEKPAKLAELYVSDDFLSAEGVWRADELTDKTETPFPSVTLLECYRNGGKNLVGSDGYCMQATASIMLGNPEIEVDYYPVLSWDKDKLIAANSSTAPRPICIWTQLTINLHDHSVMATDTRKLGKGHEGFANSCELYPLAQTYHLVDKEQELTRRQLRAERISKEKK